MKKLTAILMSLVLTASVSACGMQDDSSQKSGGQVRTEVSSVLVEPTCLTEGYVERTYSDGYIARDTFTQKTQHHYVEVSLGGEENIKRQICQDCGKENIHFTNEVISTEVTVDVNRERPKFAGHADARICSMVIEQTADDAIRAIRLSEKHGANAIMIYVSNLDPEYRNLQDLQRIMHCTDLPVLAIAYGTSYFHQQSLSFDEMAGLLKLSVQAGAAAIDLQGFMWSYVDVRSEQKTYRSYWEEKGFSMTFVSSAPSEVCLNPSVLQVQQAFAREIQEMGADVLLSIHAGVALNATQAVDLVRFVEAQGVDVVKLVLSGSSKATVLEHLKAILTLSETSTCDFSIHGQSTLSRLMGPMFGSYIAFCVDEYTQVQTNIQIDLETMVNLLKSPEMQGAV